MTTLVCSLFGCNRVRTSYEPLTAVQPTTTTAYRAAQFYEQDVGAILNAGGKPIGELDANGSGASSFATIDDRALKAAAARGGTHVIRTRKDLQSVYMQLTQARADTNCSATTANSQCSTVYSDAMFAKIADLPSAHYIVWWVPCSNWERLPEQLRPVSYTGCDRDPVPPSRPRLPSEPARGTALADAGETESPLADGSDYVDAACRIDGPATTRLPFDRSGAARAVREGEVNSLKCAWAGKPGVTLVLSFGQSGCVHNVHIEEPQVEASFAQCIIRAFASVSVPPFAGDAVSVSKHLGAR